MDMYSGGDAKEDFEYLYIEAPLDEAESIFYARYGHVPDRVSCTCCGEDYSVTESATLEEATKYERRRDWRDREDLIPLDEYLKRDNVAVIRDSEIDGEERRLTLPQQGYCWID
jgi:hypothetical protein